MTITSAPSARPTSQAPTASPTPLPRPEILGFTGPNVVSFLTSTSSAESSPATPSPTASSSSSSSSSFVGIQVQSIGNTGSNGGLLDVVDCVFENPRNGTSQIFFSVVQGVPEFAFQSATGITNPLVMSAAAFPFEFASDSGNITGPIPTSNTLDLTAYALSCFTVANAAVELLPNITSVLSLEYDQSTGDVRVLGLPSGEFPFAVQTCPVFWLGVNLVGREFANSPITDAFHLVRNSAGEFMTFPTDPAFPTYFANMIVGAIPFWAITLLCLFLYPSVLCVRLYLNLKHNATSCPSCVAWLCFCQGCCGRGKTRRRRGADAAANQKDPLIKRNRAEEYRQEIRAILAPQPLRQRICFLFMGLFVLGCVLAIIISVVVVNHTESFINTLNLNPMFEANQQAVVLLDVLQQVVLQAQGPGAYQTALEQSVYASMVPVAEYAILSNPVNIRPSSLANTFFYPDWTVAIEVVVYGGLALVPVFVLWALVLSSCTFRYEDRVKCGGVSRCLGGWLRCYMITAAACCWGIVMFAFYGVSVNADVCFFPSLYYMPLTNSSQLNASAVANTGQFLPFFAQPSQLGKFNPQNGDYAFYDATSDNYLFNGVNTAVFFFECEYAAVPATAPAPATTESSDPSTTITASSSALNSSQPTGNPFIQFMSAAFAANEESLRLARANGDEQAVFGLELASQGMRNLSRAMACENFGSGLINSLVDNMCVDGVTYNFVLFLFLIIMGTTLMIFIPCSNWVHPNIYRQILANRVFDRVQRERVQRIKQTASRNQNLGEDGGEEGSGGGGGGEVSPSEMDNATSRRRLGDLSDDDDEGDAESEGNKSTSFLRKASLLIPSFGHFSVRSERRGRGGSLGGARGSSMGGGGGGGEEGSAAAVGGGGGRSGGEELEEEGRRRRPRRNNSKNNNQYEDDPNNTSGLRPETSSGKALDYTFNHDLSHV